MVSFDNSPVGARGGVSLFNERTFVGRLPPARMRSNSASRDWELRGTLPTTYGLPLSVCAFCHCFWLFLPGDRKAPRPGRRRDGLLPSFSSAERYSAGTNSSKRMSVVATRGSCGAPSSTLLRPRGDERLASFRDVGRDLNSTYNTVSHLGFKRALDHAPKPNYNP